MTRVLKSKEDYDDFKAECDDMDEYPSSSVREPDSYPVFVVYDLIGDINNRDYVHFEYISFEEMVDAMRVMDRVAVEMSV